MTPPTVGTYWRTLRHLRWSQLGYLARRRLFRRIQLQRRWGRAEVHLRVLPRHPGFPEWQPNSVRQMIERSEFCLLNETHSWLGGIPWSAKGFSRLWLYHLHYCDFLNVDLSAPKHRFHLRKALEVALDWLEQNPADEGIGWEPYPLSLRIVNWLKFLVRNATRLEAIGESEALCRILTSLRVQALSLEDQLELDLLGNHLLKNLKALMFAGALLEAPEGPRWWADGERLLKRELAEQILPDGGHFERSPMYHAEALEDLLDIRTLALACGRVSDCTPQLSERVAKMAGWLRAILHPDGEIPLFNDSAFGIARPAGELLTLAGESSGISPSGRPEVSVLPETGYAVIRAPDSESCLIFDCGPLGPDYQPGHGHCDVLSYELSLHGQRVVVDTGVSTYERCTERRYERSTAAHNTLRIDGEEQAEIWASFRVGRRPRVGRIEGGEISGCHFVQGEHYGYQHRNVIHSRTIVHAPEDSWVVVDSVRGKGHHRVESFIHFHPAIRIEPCANGEGLGVEVMRQRWIIQFANHRYFLMTLGAGELALRESWYAPEFGLRQRQSVVHWTWQGELPARMLYAFVPVGGRPLAIRQVRDEKAIEINRILVPLK